MPTNVKVKAAPDRRCFYTPEGPEIEGDYFRSVPSNDLIESQIASGDLLVEEVAVKFATSGFVTTGITAPAATASAGIPPFYSAIVQSPPTVPQTSVVGVSAVDSSYTYQAPIVASSYVGTTSSALPTT